MQTLLIAVPMVAGWILDVIYQSRSNAILRDAGLREQMKVSRVPIKMFRDVIVKTGDPNLIARMKSTITYGRISIVMVAIAVFGILRNMFGC